MSTMNTHRLQSPYFSQTQRQRTPRYDEPIFEYQQPTQLLPVTPPRRSTKKENTIPIKEIQYCDTDHTIDHLYYFSSPRKCAQLWSSYLRRPINPEAAKLDFTLTTTHRTGNTDIPAANPLIFHSETILLVHPILGINDFNPVHLYMPLISEGESEISFSKVTFVRAKPHQPWNVQLSVVENNCENKVYNDCRERSRRSEIITNSLQDRSGAEFQLQQSYQQISISPVNNYFGSEFPTLVLPNPPNTCPPPIIHQQLVHISGSAPPPISQEQSSSPLQVYASSLNAVHQDLATSSPTKPGSPQTPFKKGYLAICKNCGIASANLQTCCRCKKPVKGKVIKDPFAPPSPKLGRGNRDEIVELSSDEDLESLDTPPTVSKIMKTMNTTNSPNGVEPNERPSPEKVIKLLANMSNNSAGTDQFVLMPCKFIRVGNYRIDSSLDFPLNVTIGEIGIYFQLPGCDNVVKEIGIPKHQILTVRAYFEEHASFMEITTGPKLAGWVRGILNMDKDSSGANYFCSLYGDDTQKELILMFSEYHQQNMHLMDLMYKGVITALENHDAVLRMGKWSIEASYSGSTEKKLEASSGNPPISSRTRSTSITPAIQATPQPQIEVENQKLFHYPLATTQNNGTSGNGNNNVFMENCITINDNDIPCLAPESYLNDQMVAFWIRHIVDELKPELKEKIYVYNTFFYTRLTSKSTAKKRKSITPWEFDPTLSSAEKRHMRVKGWTKKIDIFEKDFLFIPINDGSCHWFLAVVCYPGLAELKKLPRPKNLGRRKAKISEDATNGKEGNCVKAEAESTKKLPETTENINPDRDEAPEDEETSEEVEDEPMETDDMHEGSQAPKEQPVSPPVSVSTGSQSKSTASGKISSSSQEVPKVGEHFPCILVFDSLGAESHYKTFSTLREYLSCEYASRKSPDKKVFDKLTMPGVDAIVPQQPNLFDCGIYVLQYVESFFNEPIKNFPGGKKINLENWFPEEVALNKREVIYKFIKDYVKQNFPENSHLVPELTFST